MKSLLFVFLSLLVAAPARADVFGGFTQFATQGNLKPFARDLADLLGSGTFQSGRPLGFSGFDAGGRAGVQFSPDKNDVILRNHGVHAFWLPWVQAEIGMPKGIDGFIRGVSDQGLTIAGGGLRYGFRNASDKPWEPQLLLVGVAHSVVHQYFSATHAGGSLVYSMGTAFFTPYLGAGFDHMRLVARSASAADAALNGAAVNTFESRFTAGMRLRPWTFVYINAAYILAHGNSGAEAGLGVRF